MVRELTGVPIYRDRLGVDREKIPYGNDPTRWIPELSALLVQTEGLISSQVVEPLGGDGLEVTYAPFEGRSRTVNLSDPPVQDAARLLVVPRRPLPGRSRAPLALVVLLRRRRPPPPASMWCHSAAGGPWSAGRRPPHR